MDERTAVTVGAAALIAALVIVAYVVRRVRLRETKRRIGEFLVGYFNGDLPLDQLTRRAPGAPALPPRRSLLLLQSLRPLRLLLLRRLRSSLGPLLRNSL